MSENMVYFESVSESNVAVSSGDAAQAYISVSASDALEGLAVDVAHIDLICTALLFFLAFSWVETRIKNGVKKVTNYE